VTATANTVMQDLHKIQEFKASGIEKTIEELGFRV
jgi:hypothetical protein